MRNDQSLALRQVRSYYPDKFLRAAPKSRFSFVDLWKVLSRRRTIVFASTALAFLIGIIVYIATPRLYRAEAKLQILKQDGLPAGSDPSQASTSAADSADFKVALQTEVEVLRSRNITLRVIRDLGMDQERDYQVSDSDRANSKGSFESSPKRMAYALDTYSRRLTVEPVSGTRLIAVSFLDRSPERATQVVNQLLADFLQFNYQVRLAASAQANAILSSELQSMKTQVDASQANVAKLQQQSGIYTVDQASNVINTRLEQLNAQLTTAQSNLALKQSLYRLAITRSPEVLVGMLRDTGSASTSMSNASLQTLRQQQADAAATYAELNAHYGSQYPKVLQAGQRLQSIQASINAEIDRLVAQATAEYKVAVETESAAAKALQLQKGMASQLNRDAAVYTSAKHEADTSRDTYEQLQRRLKEAGVLASLRSTNLNILDSAIRPDKPAQPLFFLYLGTSILFGLVIGVIAAFVVDLFDRSIRDPQKIEDLLGIPVLALIPPVERSLPKAAIQSLRRSTPGSAWQYLTTAKAPRSHVAEAFRVLRTAILTSVQSEKETVLAITSTSESEGKSFTTFNLAAAFAQSGRTILVIDADLRKRTLTHALGLEDRDGLDEAFGDSSWQQYVTTYEEVPGLFVLPAGHQAHYPSDVLGSPAMIELLGHVRKAFDYVLIDTPSILDVTDTVSLSAAVDGVLVIAKCGHTAQHSLVRTLAVLRRANARVLGVIFNGIDYTSTDFYYYWGKQSSGYAPTTTQIFSPATKMIAGRTTLMLLLAMALASSTIGQSPAGITPLAVQSQSGSASFNASQKLVLGAGDLITISVYDAPELTQEVRVNSEGLVHLNLLGDVPAASLQPDQLAHAIEGQLHDRNLIRNPQVSVAVKEFATQGVTVEGEVKKPGVYPIYAARSLVDVLAIADGVTPSADTRVSIRRQATGKVDRVMLPQDNGNLVADNDVRVYPGDTVIIPRAGLMYVLGDVHRPGGYMMHDNGGITILQAISEAQGTTHNASLKHVILIRKEAGVTRTIPIELKAIQRGKEPDQPLMTGDILFVPASGLKTFTAETEGIASSLSGVALYTAVH